MSETALRVAQSGTNTRWATLSVVLTASAQVALPLSGGAVPVVTTVVVLGMTVATYLFARNTWGSERMVSVFLLVTAFSLVIEAIGFRTGLPFGTYTYTDVLQPQVVGVPVIVTLAWFAMAVPSWEMARRITPNRPFRLLLGGFGLVIWDLFLDPQMTRNDFWRFEGTGWQGIPLTNFVGWLVVGVAIMTLLDHLLENRPANNGLAFLYTWMIGLSAVGFLLPFALNRPLVGIVGLVAATPFLFLALRSKPRPWLTSAL